MEKLFQDVDCLCCGRKDTRTDVPVSSLKGEDKVLGLFFSAHWCPPCRVFTPNLIDWYTRLREGVAKDKLEIVYISLDKDEKTFDEYYETMPWLALPYKYRERETKLVRKFKISGIPSLVLLNAQTCSTITRDGRSFVVDNPNGEGFPWHPQNILSCLTGEFINKDGGCISWDDIKEIKVLGLYFSAQWCQPCQSFTPLLIEFYRKMNQDQQKRFEIVFVTSDRSETTFYEYLPDMPWLAIPFTDERCKKLKQLLEVTSIPLLILLDTTTGKVITTNARTMVTVDPEGEEFPWYPKALELLHDGVVNVVNDRPAMVWFTDGSPEQLEQAIQSMSPVAQFYFEQHKDNLDEAVCFFYANDSDLSASLREEVIKMPETFPTLVIVDIPDQKKYICDTPELNEEAVRNFLHSYSNGTHKAKSLQ